MTSTERDRRPGPGARDRAAAVAREGTSATAPARARSSRRCERGRQVLVAGAALVALLSGVGSWWVGWWSAPRPWRETIGLDDLVTAGTGAASGPAWSSGAGAVAPPELEWLGHAGFVVRWQGATFLLDPNVDGWCTVARRRLRPPPDLAAVGPVDAVLVSHAHLDHLDLPSLARVPRPTAIVLPAGSERYLDDPGEAMPVRAGDVGRFGAIEVIAVPAAHNGNRWHPFASRLQALGYVLRSGGEAIYFAGDTGLTNDFDDIGRRFHPRLAILPIGAFRPRVVMRRYHLSPEEAVEAAKRLGATTVVPCHFGTFTLALDRPDEALPRFAAAARRRGQRWILPPLAGAEALAAAEPGSRSAELAQ